MRSGAAMFDLPDTPWTHHGRQAPPTPDRKASLVPGPKPRTAASGRAGSSSKSVLDWPIRRTGRRGSRTEGDTDLSEAGGFADRSGGNRAASSSTFFWLIGEFRETRRFGQRRAPAGISCSSQLPRSATARKTERERIQLKP